MTPSSKTLLTLLASLSLVGCANLFGKKPAAPVTANKPVAGKLAKPASPAKPVTPPDTAKDANGQFEDALAALKAKQLPQARAGFELLAKEHPEFSGPLTNLGIIEAKGSTREAAMADFTKAVAANPRNAVAYNWLGILYRESKNYGKAEQSYLQSLVINPDNAAVVLNLGILYDVYLKRPADALTRYRDYQRMTNNRELKVTAWIKALETPAPTAAPAIAPSAVIKK